MRVLRAGDLLARRYRLIDPVGAGGMSVIWRAHDEVLDRLVAVKVLAAALAADARFRAMVRAEARSAAQLVHPHVTAVHDYGETVAPDGAVIAFVVLELLSGESLEARLTAGPLPWPEAVRVCAEVAEALAAAHRLGIVHRDVTPGNVMLTAVGAKMLDFGIATRVDAPDDDDTGETFGTPAYVAPERLDGRPARPTGDVYSFGVLLYETLTGRVPHPADTWDELPESLNRPAPPLAVPDLPPAVATACRRCLSRDPYARPTAHQVAEVLRAHLPGGPEPTPAPGGVPPGMVDPGASDPAMPKVPADPTVTGIPAGTAVAELPAGPAIPTGDSAPTGSTGPVDGTVAEAATPPGAAPPHRRHRYVAAMGASLAVLAAVVVALFAARLDPDPPNGRAGGPPAADAGIGPANPAPATHPGTSASSAPAPRRTGEVPGRSAERPATTGGTGGTVDVPTAVRAFTGLVAAGVASGDIRDDVGQDLTQVAAPLRTDPPSEVDDRVRDLRRKVSDRAGEGAISERYVERLGAGLDEIAAAGQLAS